MQDYYAILGVDKESSNKDICKAYRLLAKKYHPDKNVNGLVLFQQIQEAYSVLSDPKKRYEYDNMEEIEICTKPTTAIDPETIEEFVATYKNSEEELDDILSFYAKNDGDITDIFDYIPLADPSLVEFNRLINIINKNIKLNKIRSRPNFIKSKIALKDMLSSKIKERKLETINFIETYGTLPFDELVLKIRNKQKNNNAIAQLEAKYCKNVKKIKK